MQPIEVSSGTNTEESDRTFIVKRLELIFNEVECQILNFSEITAYKRLKQ